ncbi:MAG: hypothetical protein WCR67_02910, partial [Bacilli bacterium]
DKQRLIRNWIIASLAVILFVFIIIYFFLPAATFQNFGFFFLIFLGIGGIFGLVLYFLKDKIIEHSKKKGKV